MLGSEDDSRYVLVVDALRPPGRDAELVLGPVDIDTPVVTDEPTSEEPVASKLDELSDDWDDVWLGPGDAGGLLMR